MRENKLNDLEAKDWMKFTKTWFVHNPPPRKKDEVLHPAKYPESMIEEFIRFFTKENQVVFDPFLGTGSTLVACHNSNRKGIGIELQEKYGQIALDRIKKLEEQRTLTGLNETSSENLTSNNNNNNNSNQTVIIDDSFKVKEIWEKNNLDKIDFLICSPPYGPMLNKKGLVQEKRAKQGLDTKYSEDENDLGNTTDYNQFVSKLIDLFKEMNDIIKEGAYLVIILQNYREGPEFKTLAWDFAAEMKKHYLMTGCKIWCQDNKTLYPYGYRYSFVPNVHHHYCLVFRKEVNKNGTI